VPAGWDRVTGVATGGAAGSVCAAANEIDRQAVKAAAATSLIIAIPG
jgi:hypothetical protein